MFVLLFRFASMLSYTGLYLGIDELGENLFLNSFIGGAVEAVAFALCFVTMKTGRKGMYITLQIIGGLALFGSGFVISYSAGMSRSVDSAQNSNVALEK